MLPPFNGKTFDAGTSNFFEATFTDRFGNPATPTVLTQELFDITNGKQLLASTPINPPASGNTLEIPIPASLNVMTENGAWLQVNRLVLTATYADGSDTVQHFWYRLVNPQNLPGELP